MDVISLQQSTLSSLPTTVAVPEYDRQALQSGIVHVGVGGFHRSHQAFYTVTILTVVMIYAGVYVVLVYVKQTA